jgi:DNA-directed RNA polymerase specialized sigma24 family protein
MKFSARLAFELNRLGGFSYAEIADVMAVSVSMIEKHISLALRHLRTVL